MQEKKLMNDLSSTWINKQLSGIIQFWSNLKLDGDEISQLYSIETMPGTFTVDLVVIYVFQK